MNKWKLSLTKEPVMLEHSMSLLPVSEIVTKIDGKKGKACMEALQEMLGDSYDFQNKQKVGKAEKITVGQEGKSLHGCMQVMLHNSCYSSRAEASKKSTPEKKEGCFPPNATVTIRMNNRNKCSVQMKGLKVGDKVHTLRNGISEFTKVVSFLHRDMDVEAEFVKITFDNGSQLKVTGNHLLLTQRGNCDVITSKPACEVEVGDGDVMSGEGERVRVVRVESERHKGIFCPLTESGTIVVDGILCSCYASVRNFNFGLFQISGHKVREMICLFDL